VTNREHIQGPDCRCLSCVVTRGVLAGPGNVVSVPVTGSYLVVDGEVVRVHEVRKEADFLLNRCEPEDICGAEDGCNT